MAEANSKRPLSPHIGIYRWQITMVMSIVHRATGIALTVGTLLLAWWLIAAATGPEAYETVRAFVASPIGILMLLGWTWSLMHHLASGIRHMVWDTGSALTLPSVYTTGWAAAVAGIVLTAAVWIAAFLIW